MAQGQVLIGAVMRLVRPEGPAHLTPPAADRTSGAVEARSLRLESVDALRGSAFLMVFVFHCFLELNTGTGGLVGAIYSSRWNFFFPHHFGALGVQLFFVLSGYCIHRSALSWRAAHPYADAKTWSRTYLWRRFVRIYPMYLASIIILQLVSEGRWRDFLWHAVFAQTLVPDQVNRLNPSLWSLAVEAQLYALYPLVLLAMDRWGALRTLAACAIASVCWRLAVPEHMWWSAMPWRWGLEWFLGAAVAHTQTARAWIGGRSLGLIWIALVVALAVSRSDILYSFAPPLAFAASLGFLVRLSSWRPPQWLCAAGTVSYGLYLVHQPVLKGLSNLGQASGLDTAHSGVFLAATGLALAISVSLAVLLERGGRIVQIALTDRSPPPRPHTPASADDPRRPPMSNE